MKKQRGAAEVSLITLLVFMVAIMMLAPRITSAVKGQLNGEIGRGEIEVLASSVSAYFSKHCKGALVQPTIAILVNEGLLDTAKIDTIDGAVSSISVSNTLANPTVVIQLLEANLQYPDNVVDMTPGASLSGGIITVNRRFEKVSNVGYGYDGLFNKECGR